MTGAADSTVVDRCPLCSADNLVKDSIPQPNLYSEKLAGLLGQDERRLLNDHANWRCKRCDLVFKRKWFSEDLIRALFTGSVGSHPRGWDSLADRFSASVFLHTVQRWMVAVESQATQEIRRGVREILSIVDSIAQPVGFEPEAFAVAVRSGDLVAVSASSGAVAASIDKPADFKRFAGFRSAALWGYLQERTGGFSRYAEVGCPLWGLLPRAVEYGCKATYLVRAETNYWGAGCVRDAESCSDRLCRSPGIQRASWSSPSRYQLVGVFQYLDHPVDPRQFLHELFAKSDGAAIILDAMEFPPAIQHPTGWTDTSIAYAAALLGKNVHSDFEDIRPSGNRLYLLTDQS